MKVQQFNVALDENYKNVLVKESVIDFPEVERLHSSRDVVKVMRSIFALQDRAEEYLYLICMAVGGRPIGFFEVSHGTCLAAPVGIREVLIRALLCSAIGIILVHNHPEGKITPSDADMEITEQIRQACLTVGLGLYDHIIITRDAYVSFKDMDILPSDTLPDPLPGMSS